MKSDDQPKGTLAILILYLVLLIAIWGLVYKIMLQRGGI
ncbi:MAG: cytochrome c oxidase subunit 2A [Anaerolineae bacterium]|nr:cytochrome c oxidase subunit 2A [Anaerolineae bacterium]